MTVIEKRPGVQRGFGSDERPVTKVLWERDEATRNSILMEEGNVEPDNRFVDYSVYYDPEFAKREYEHVFMKSWQWACREEDLPNVGDRTTYRMGARSFMIVRSGEDEYKAFFNACPHRGTRLCDDHASGDSIKCPFHAWTWNLDGSLKYIPSHWDFKGIGPKNGRLREVNLARWGGFIFINADPDAAPLADALSIVPAHFAAAGFDYSTRYTAARFRKLTKANWKTVQEAFHESYHVVETHPEGVPFNGDSQTQYDVWDSPNGTVGRQVTPSAVPSMHAPADATNLAAATVYAQIMEQWHYNGVELPVLDETQDLRAQLADWHRKAQKEVYGVDNPAPGAVMIDSLLYFTYPNMCFWLSESLPFVYRFTPHETDPNLSYYEVHMLLPFDKDGERPAPVPMIELGPDDLIAPNVPAYGFLATIFDQDMANMPRVQEGMKSADPEMSHSQMGIYQEMLIQQWHLVSARRIAEGEAKKAAAAASA